MKVPCRLKLVIQWLRFAFAAAGLTGLTKPLEDQQVPRLLVGFNNWKVKPEPIMMQHSSVPGEDDEMWWEASFSVPKDCASVSFVVNCENTWDNNGGKDHKVSFLLGAWKFTVNIG
jgi:hypothetical protein